MNIKNEQPQSSIHAHTVAFICSANLCRSLMAHAIFTAEIKKRGIPAQTISAGLYDFEGVLAAREARLACDRHNTPMPKFVSTYFRNVDLSNAVRVFVMTEDHVELLQTGSSIPAERISLLGKLDPKHRGDEIDDPIGKESAEFDKCYEQLHDCICHYLDTTKELG